jgi:hypothetical protein
LKRARRSASRTSSTITAPCSFRAATMRSAGLLATIRGMLARIGVLDVASDIRG